MKKVLERKASLFVTGFVQFKLRFRGYIEYNTVNSRQSRFEVNKDIVKFI